MNVEWSFVVLVPLFVFASIVYLGFIFGPGFVILIMCVVLYRLTIILLRKSELVALLFILALRARVSFCAKMSLIRGAMGRSVIILWHVLAILICFGLNLAFYHTTDLIILHVFCHLLTFFQSIITVLNVLWSLIWVRTVFKGDQQTTLIGKEF